MTEYEILDIAREAMMVTLKMSAPSLIAALVVGFVIGLVQALTSIQEQTLTFVPKIGVMIAVLWVATDSMAHMISEFFKGPILGAILRI
jgi:flagellar biosynthetic protein FliQ